MNSVEQLVEKYFGVWHCDHKEVTQYSKPIISHNHLYKKKSIEQLHLSIGINGLEQEMRVYTLY